MLKKSGTGREQINRIRAQESSFRKPAAQKKTPDAPRFSTRPSPDNSVFKVHARRLASVMGLHS